MFCPQCNTYLDDDLSFCTNCGSRVDEAETVIRPHVIAAAKPSGLSFLKTIGLLVAGAIVALIGVAFFLDQRPAVTPSNETKGNSIGNAVVQSTPAAMPTPAENVADRVKAKTPSPARGNLNANSNRSEYYLPYELPANIRAANARRVDGPPRYANSAANAMRYQLPANNIRKP